MRTGKKNKVIFHGSFNLHRNFLPGVAFIYKNIKSGCTAEGGILTWLLTNKQINGP